MRLCIAFAVPRFVSFGFKLMGIARALFEKRHPTARLSVMHGATLLLLRQRQVRFGAVLGSSISHFIFVSERNSIDVLNKFRSPFVNS